MPVTAQWLFERAMALMDEGDPHTGEMDCPEARGYKHRALGILNVLGEECRAALGQKAPWRELRDFETPLALEESAARGVLPYGLAAHLFLEEDPAAANFFQRRYEELLEARRRRGRARAEEIVLPYGGLTAHGEGRGRPWR